MLVACSTPEYYVLVHLLSGYSPCGYERDHCHSCKTVHVSDTSQANHRESLCFSSSPEILFLDSFLSLNPLTTEYYGILVRSTASHLLINPDCVLLNILTY